MKQKHFYSHLISFEQIKIELSTTNLSEEEQKELLELAGKQLHHVLLDTALTHLKGMDKELFLYHVHQEQHDKAWELLRKHAKDIESHLLQVSHSLYEILRKDIQEIKKISNS